MSIYGDMGNIIALRYRLEKVGIDLVYQIVEPDNELPIKNDFYFIGGGQNKDQNLIFQDLSSKSNKIKEDIEQGVPILAICGGYQLLGNSFITGDNTEIPGIGIFPVITKAPDNSVKSRCIGNIVVKSQIPELESIFVGFENHSGQTFFVDTPSKAAQEVGTVLHGYGNNVKEKKEGCMYKNAIGTYMHGSCLPKNPELADYMISKALENKKRKGEIPVDFDFQIQKKKINDTVALQAKQYIILKYR